jgi:hypothetical protein
LFVSSECDFEGEGISKGKKQGRTLIENLPVEEGKGFAGWDGLKDKVNSQTP